MPPDSTSFTAADLREWRTSKGYSLARVAGLLGVSSPNTIKTWEDEEVKIPGPAVLVLRWLIYGQVPFAPDASGAGLGSLVRDDIGGVEMTVDAFEECLRRAREAGFGTVTEWIAELVRQELRGKPEGETLRPGAEETPLPQRREVSYTGKSECTN